jgi:stalled ribosome rescue protein Dom34
MKKTGIWLDKNKAIIVTLENDDESMNTVVSGLEDFHVTSHKSEGGPLEIAKDAKYLERRKHQYKSYFKDIVAKIKDSDALVIFGPAQTNEKFNKELSENFKAISAKVKAVKKTDSMTDNQIKAWVRHFYNL